MKAAMDLIDKIDRANKLKTSFKSQRKDVKEILHNVLSDENKDKNTEGDCIKK